LGWVKSIPRCMIIPAYWRVENAFTIASTLDGDSKKLLGRSRDPRIADVPPLLGGIKENTEK
jgi:hypothetical protein